MSFSTYRYHNNSGPTQINNRSSWGPVTTHNQIDNKTFNKRLSGNYDRIINSFDRTNTFECVRSAFEQASTNTNSRSNKDTINTIIKDSEKSQHTTAPDQVDSSVICVKATTPPVRPMNIVLDKQTVESEKKERFVGFSDLVVNRKANGDNVSSSFERADIGLAARQTPCTDEDVTAYYQDRLYMSQARQLFPLQEDLADWINKTIGISYLTGDNFLEVLDNGVELCQLATVIREKSKEAYDKGIYNGEIPVLRGRCWQRAARRSFFSRDNMENFINFCRQLGVHENLLFESDDLVLHAQPRNVILCLLELARIATKFQVEPPGLVQLEREIALEEEGAFASLHDNMTATLAWQFQQNSGPDPNIDRIKSEPPPSPVDHEVSLPATLFAESEGTPSVHTDDTWSRGTPEDPDSIPVKPLSELDKRVQIVTRLMQRNCNCSEGKCSKLLKVKKVGEGRYNIAGRNVFIRLLKGRHMMVRVGGGWDTLEHFLSRHDPCQVRVISPQSSASITKITTVNLMRQSRANSTNSVDSICTNQSSDKNSTGDISPIESIERHIFKIRKASTSSVSSRKSTRDSNDSKSNKDDSNSDTSSVNGAVTTRVNQILKSYTPNNKSLSKSSSSNNSKNSSGRTTPQSSGKVSPVAKPNGRAMSLGSNPRFNGKMSPANLKLDLTPINNSSKTSKIINNRMESPIESTKKSITSTGKYQKGQVPRTQLNSGRKSLPSVTSNSELSVRRRSLNFPLPTTNTKTLKSPSQSASKLLVSPSSNKTFIPNRRNSLNSPVGTGKSFVTPSSVEKSVQMALPLQSGTDSKPFLHIRAKYRSPPPRDVPPR